MKPKCDILLTFQDKDLESVIRIASTTGEETGKLMVSRLQHYLKDGAKVSFEVVPSRFS